MNTTCLCCFGMYFPRSVFLDDKRFLHSFSLSCLSGRFTSSDCVKEGKVLHPHLVKNLLQLAILQLHILSQFLPCSFYCHGFPLDLLFKQISYYPGMFPHLQWKCWGVLKPGWSFRLYHKSHQIRFLWGFRFFCKYLIAVEYGPSNTPGFLLLNYCRCCCCVRMNLSFQVHHHLFPVCYKICSLWCKIGDKFQIESLLMLIMRLTCFVTAFVKISSVDAEEGLLPANCGLSRILKFRLCAS